MEVFKASVGSKWTIDTVCGNTVGTWAKANSEASMPKSNSAASGARIQILGRTEIPMHAFRLTYSVRSVVLRFGRNLKATQNRHHLNI